MSETLLYLQEAFSIFQEMRSRRMSQSMNSDRAVVAGLHQCILHDDTHISRLDGLRRHTSAMRLEDEVITGEPLLEALQHFDLLFRDGYAAVLLAFALIDKNLLTVKTYINPLEAACLAYS